MTAAAFVPADPQFEARVRASYQLQGIHATLGNELMEVAPGRVVIELNWAPGLTQQHGFLHAGVVTTALDTACGYAAYTLMPLNAAVLTIEFKVNLLAPAKGDRFRFEGVVIKPGRTITVTHAEAYALGGAAPKLIATMSATMMAVQGRPDLAP